jgi:hypothetical protein
MVHRLLMIYLSDFNDNILNFRDAPRSASERAGALPYPKGLGSQPCWFNANEGREVQNHSIKPF